MMDSLLLASTQPMANTKDICLKIDCNNGFNGPAPPIMRIFTIQDMVTRHQGSIFTVVRSSETTKKSYGRPKHYELKLKKYII